MKSLLLTLLLSTGLISATYQPHGWWPMSEQRAAEVTYHRKGALTAIKESHWWDFNEHFRALFGHELRDTPEALYAGQMNLIRELRDVAKSIISTGFVFLSVIMIHEFLCKWAEVQTVLK